LSAAIIVARDDAEVRAVVLTGSGGFFCAGGDLKAMSAGFSPVESRARMLKTDRSIIAALFELEKPVIGMVNGMAIGIGCDLALATDIIIASETSKFAANFVRMGLIPDVGSLFLMPRVIGLHKAKELIFTGDSIDALEAQKIGLINKVVPEADLEETVMSLARRLAKGAHSIGLAKALLHRALTTDLDGAIELQALGQSLCFQTEDHKEAVRAFFEKRAPQFKGK
jgi:2-(1,2-epoxy-1,2-dihydrophenyl)acetyl-CoA isomerase